MSLSKICLLMACFYTLLNVAVSGYFGHPWLGALVSLPADAVIWGVWMGIKVQVQR